MNVRARQFHIRFVQGGFPQAEGFYGADTYGAEYATYGSEVGEATIPGVQYFVMPVSGRRPSDPAWLFRIGDTANKFEAMIVERESPSKRLGLESVVDAYLVLSQTNANAGVYQQAHLLEWDEDTDIFFRTWEADDLVRPGRYMVTLRLLFKSGRFMSIEANDETLFEVYESYVDQVD